MNNCNKGPDNGKSVSDSNQTYMVDTALGLNKKPRLFCLVSKSGRG